MLPFQGWTSTPSTLGQGKAGADQNYGSRGASVNLEIELDASLVKEPTKLQEKIRYLFNLARQSLTEELNGKSHPPNPVNGNGHANGNGNGTRPRGGGQRQATQSQVKAIHAIARNRRIDVARFLSERIHVNRPDDLTIKEASKAIDELKADSNSERME